MTQNFDVVVLGAGIVGAASALECARTGLRVAVVEPSVPGGGASAAGMGHIVVMDDSPAQLALSRYGRELWRAMRDSLPKSAEYQERGTLWVAADDEEMQEVFAKQKTYQRTAVEAEVLDTQSLAQAEPELRPGLAGALLVPQDAVVYPPAAVRHFMEESLRLGAKLLRGVQPVKAAEGLVRLQDGTQITAGAIVIATGVDTSLAPWITVQPRKGHLVITDRYPGFVHHQLVELGYLKNAHKVAADSVAFNVQPRQTGQLLLGSSRQFDGVDAAVDPTILRAMLDRAIEYLPRVRSLSAIRVWTGFRAATPDKLPLIGPTPDPTVFLAMGFEGLGITNAPAAARLLADHLLRRASDLDPAPFLPERILQTEVLHA